MIRHNGIELDRVRQIIRHRGKEKKFSTILAAGAKPVAFRFWEALILGECTRQQLFEILYGHDPEGGPNGGHNILNVRVCMWRHQFAAMELYWHCEKRGGIAHWCLLPVPLEEAQAA